MQTIIAHFAVLVLVSVNYRKQTNKAREEYEVICSKILTKPQLHQCLELD